MTYPRLPKNIKVCPECGTNLIVTARHCAVCGYQFTEDDLAPLKEAGGSKKRLSLTPIINKLLLFVGLVLLTLAMSNLLILGLQKRAETKIHVDSARATATYLATTYVSPTPIPTATFTPGPPTETPVVDIEYTVVSGDSCLSIVTRFNIDLGTLLRKNDINCENLKIGTVLKFPPPTPTPEPSFTPTP